MDQLNTNTIKQLSLIDDSVKAAQRIVRVNVSELDESNSETITVKTNLQLNQVMDIISKRIKDEADRLLIMQKTKELSDLVESYKKQAAQITDYALITLQEMAAVKKVNDDLIKQTQDAKKEYLDFREKMIKKFEDLEKKNNESEGLNNG